MRGAYEGSSCLWHETEERLCEVKIVDEMGKRHKLQVDVQTNQVVKAK